MLGYGKLFFLMRFWNDEVLSVLIGLMSQKAYVLSIKGSVIFIITAFGDLSNRKA